MQACSLHSSLCTVQSPKPSNGTTHFWAGTSHMIQSRQPLQDLPTGHLNLDSLSLRRPQVIGDYHSVYLRTWPHHKSRDTCATISACPAILGFCLYYFAGILDFGSHSSMVFGSTKFPSPWELSGGLGGQRGWFCSGTVAFWPLRNGVHVHYWCFFWNYLIFSICFHWFAKTWAEFSIVILFLSPIHGYFPILSPNYVYVSLFFHD